MWCYVCKTIQNTFSMYHLRDVRKNILNKLVLAWHDIIEFKSFHCSSFCFFCTVSYFIVVRNEAKFKWCSHSCKKKKRSIYSNVIYIMWLILRKSFTLVEISKNGCQNYPLARKCSGEWYGIHLWRCQAKWKLS